MVVIRAVQDGDGELREKIPGLGRQSWADRIIGGGVVGVAIVVVEAVQDGDGERTEESVRLSCRKSRTGWVGASKGSYFGRVESRFVLIVFRQRHASRIPVGRND